MNITTTRADRLHRCRVRRLYALCLAIQGIEPATRALPWTALRWRLASAELTALQAHDIERADYWRAKRQAHEALADGKPVARAMGDQP